MWKGSQVAEDPQRRSAGDGTGPISAFLERRFHLTELRTDPKTELAAGLTTFMVMAYIIFVNPIILVNAGLEISATTTATALVTGILTILMGLATNRAYAIAPGMGLNAIVAFQLVGQMELTAAQAMGVVVSSGILILVLVLAGVRKWVMEIVPIELKQGIAVGIGLFILFIGLINGRIVVSDPDTFVTMGDLRGVPVFITAVGLLLTIALMAMNFRGAILWGILGSTTIAVIAREITGTEEFVPGQAELPDRWIATPDFSRIGEFSFGFFLELGILTAVLVVIALMMADFFDTMGTLIGVGSQAGYLDENGELPEAQRALLVDSLGTIAGGAASSSSATTYIESSAGVGVGGRSGLVSIVVGVLFLLSMPFWPVVGMVPTEATAPALIIVGWMMMGVLTERTYVTPQGRKIRMGGVDFTDIEKGLPVVAAMVIMPLTYNITNGIGAGFVVYTLVKVFRGKAREVHPVMYVVSLLFLIYFLRTFIGVDL
jgi:adenine/guanine/hypoxanthine permease